MLKQHVQRPQSRALFSHHLRNQSTTSYFSEMQAQLCLRDLMLVVDVFKQDLRYVYIREFVYNILGAYVFSLVYFRLQ